MISTIVATVSSVALNIVLIPRYGAVGAAWANSASLAVFCIPQLWFAKTILRGLSVVRLLRTPLAVSATVVAVIVALKLNWLLAILAFLLLSSAVFLYLKRRQGLQG